MINFDLEISKTSVHFEKFQKNAKYIPVRFVEYFIKLYKGFLRMLMNNFLF